MHRALIALFSLLMLHGTAAAQWQRRLAFVVGIEDYRDLRGIVRPRGPSIALAIMTTTHTRFSPEHCSAVFRKAGRWLVLLVPFERR